jgi:hypothetical protein
MWRPLSPSIAQQHVRRLVREQWAYSQRTGGEFVAILKQVKVSLKIHPSTLRSPRAIRHLGMEAKGGIGEPSPALSPGNLASRIQAYPS